MFSRADPPRNRIGKRQARGPQVLCEAHVRIARLPDIAGRAHVARIRERINGRAADHFGNLGVNMRVRSSRRGSLEKRAAHLPAFVTSSQGLYIDPGVCMRSLVLAAVAYVLQNPNVLPRNGGIAMERIALAT